MWEAIVMCMMFVLGCVAMRRYMRWQGWVQATEIQHHIQPDDEQLMAFIKDITARWYRAARAGYSVAWFGDTAKFYTTHGKRRLYEYIWTVDTGIVDIPDEEADIYLEHQQPQRYQIPQYPPELGYENHPDW